MAPIHRFKFLEALDRSFQKLRLLISTKFSMKTKERSTKAGERHDSMFAAPEFQFPQPSQDTTNTTAHPAIYSIHNGKITIKNPSPPMPALRLQNLPLSILTRILRPLLVSPTPLILHPDAQTPCTYLTHLSPAVLRTSRLFHHVGTPLLYGRNTLTTSTALTSQSFDAHLLALPGPHRQLIKSIKLEIAWADELWAKFPLIARVMGEIVRLKKLEIVITKKASEGRKGAQMKRKVEEKTLQELVMGDLKALEELQLLGFEDDVFALTLERWVERGRSFGGR